MLSEAEGEVKEQEQELGLGRKILEPQARRMQAEADATRLNRLVVKTLGMGK